MKFEVGDKVKFLNEEGGGVVSKIITHALVNVMIEDGFEIPTSTANLVKVELDSPAGRFFYKDQAVNLPADNTIGDIADETTPERHTHLLRQTGKKQPLPGIYLAFVPHNQQWLITGPMDIFIVNATDFDIAYTYYLAETDGTMTGMDNDIIPSFTKIYLQTIDREEISDWNKGVVQILFFKENVKKIPLPASCSFNIRENKFLKEDNYITTSILESKSILTMIVELSKQSAVSTGDQEGRNSSGSAVSLSSTEYKEPALIDKHKIGPGEAEVDLHIEELVDNIKGLDPEHILKIQLDYFNKCLESGLKNQYQRLVFIHGVGNGTLKAAIREILDSKEGIKHHIAPMAKYGVGAIEVNVLPYR